MQDINGFVRTLSIRVLRRAEKGDEEKIGRAGVLVYCADEICLMLPRHGKKDKPPPEFQLAKGKREDGESMVVAALREGQEELGLCLANITQLDDLGPVTFTSQSKGTNQRMWLFGVAVKNKTDFGPPDPVHADTQRVEWITLKQLQTSAPGIGNVGIRNDHREIILACMDLIRG